MSGFEIVPAKRQSIIPLVGIYSKSNGGKTHTALLMARGIVGPEGKIVLIDTENRRGHVYSDIIPGGYRVIDFDSPFTPERYIEAIEAALKDADIIVIDSMTHEWKGEGGILEMQESELIRLAGNDYIKQEKCKMSAWIKPKMRHGKLIQKILRIPLPVICCLRGYEKTIIGKKGDKTVVETDANCTPIFDKDFISEMLMRFELTEDDKGEGGFVKKGKVRHPDLKKCIPGQNKQFGVEHGKAIADWCSVPGIAATPENVSSEGPAVSLQAEIWKLLRPIWFGFEREVQVREVEKWLKKKQILLEKESFKEACESEELMADIYAKIPIALLEE